MGGCVFRSAPSTREPASSFQDAVQCPPEHGLGVRPSGAYYIGLGALWEGALWERGTHIPAPLPQMALREPPTCLGILPSRRQEAGRWKEDGAAGSMDPSGVCTALHQPPHPVLSPSLRGSRSESKKMSRSNERKPKKEEAKRMNLKISGKRTNPTHTNDMELCKLECESVFPLLSQPQPLCLWRCVGRGHPCAYAKLEEVKFPLPHFHCRFPTGCFPAFPKQPWKGRRESPFTNPLPAPPHTSPVLVTGQTCEYHVQR